MVKYSSFRIIPELNLILCNFQGKIQIKDVIQLNIDFIGDKDYNPSYDVLIDFRNSLAIGYRIDILQYVSFFIKSIHLKKKVHVGVLYSTYNQEFLLKIYKGFGKILQMDIENFQQIDDCLVWMGFSNGNELLINEILNSLKISPLELDF